MYSFCRSPALAELKHISAHFQKTLVEKRKYITEEELIEVNALGQVLPGPTSTQTLTAIAYRLRGPNLAYLTLIISDAAVGSYHDCIWNIDGKFSR